MNVLFIQEINKKKQLLYSMDFTTRWCCQDTKLTVHFLKLLIWVILLCMEFEDEIAAVLIL